MNRREWLTGATAAGCSLGTAASLFARNAADRFIVVYDSRYSDAVCFSQELIKLGADAVDTRSDPAWIARPALLEAPATRLIGLTPASDLALLRGCAAQPGLRVVHEALHDARGTHGHLTHRIDNMRAADLATALARAGSSWPALLARQLATQPTGREAITRTELTSSHPAASDHPGTLSSWMLLPRVPFPSSGVA